MSEKGPKILTFGRGANTIYAGHFDDVPALMLSIHDKPRRIGECSRPRAELDTDELAVVLQFENTESFDVFVEEVERVGQLVRGETTVDEMRKDWQKRYEAQQAST